MAKPDVKLLMVTTDNNNKFYNLHDNDNGTMTVTYGRFGSDGTVKNYDISEWDKILNSKLKKGYTDVTKNNATVGEYAACSDAEINKLLNEFLENSRQYVAHFTETTFISDIAADNAQYQINLLGKNMDVDNPDQNTLNAFNKILLEIFKIIPRKMKNVNDAICKSLDDRGSFIVNEQQLLDNLKNMSKNAPSSTKSQTIEDAFGFNIIRCTPAEEDFLKDKLNKDGFRKTFVRAFKVKTPAREAGFTEYLENNHLANNDTNVKLYWHGTSTENLLSILANGLLISPCNTVKCGSAYGNGIYTAPDADKATGYTSISGAAWKNEHSNIGYVFLTAVIMGKMFDVKNNTEKYGNISISNLDGDKFSQADLGYHSVYAHAGGYLRRDEAIVYNQNQVACRFLVEFKG